MKVRDAPPLADFRAPHGVPQERGVDKESNLNVWMRDARDEAEEWDMVDDPTATDEAWPSTPPTSREPDRQSISPNSLHLLPTPPPSTAGNNVRISHTREDSLPRATRAQMHRNSNGSGEWDVDDDRPSTIVVEEWSPSPPDSLLRVPAGMDRTDRSVVSG